MRSAALVTREVPLNTATGIPVTVALTLLLITPVALSDAKLCKAEVLIEVALDRTPGKTDFNIPGRAEASILGRLETIEAKSVGLMLVGIDVAVIPADERADLIASEGTEVMLLAAKTEDKLPALTAEARTSVGMAVTLLADKIEDKFPEATAEATTPVGTIVMLLAARIEERSPDASKEDKLPAAMAEDKLLAIEVGIIELLADTAEEIAEAALDVMLPLTIEAKYEEPPLAETALEIFEAFEETLAKAEESDLGSIGVVAVAIIAEILASWEETAGLVAALDNIEFMAWTWEAKAGLVAVAK